MIDEHYRWLMTSGNKGTRIGSRDGDVIDLNDLNLDGVDLSLGALSFCNFQGASLKRAWLVGAELDCAVFAQCDLTFARFDRASLAATNFVHADYGKACFSGASTTEETLWTPEQKAALSEKPARSFIPFFEKAARWTVAERDGYQRQCLDDAAAAEKRCKIMMQASQGLWRSERMKVAGLGL